VLSALGRYWKLVAVLGLVGALAGLGASKVLTKTYKATVTLAVPADVSEDLLASGGPSISVGTYQANQVALLQSPAVAERAAAIVNTTEHGHVLGAQDLIDNVQVFSASSAGGTSSPGATPALAGGSGFLQAVSFTWTGSRVATEGATAVVTAYGQVRAQSLRSQASSAVAGINSSIAQVNEQLALVGYSIGVLEGQDQAALAASSSGRTVAAAPPDAAVQALLAQQTSLNNRKDQLVSRVDQVQVNEATLISSKVTSVPATVETVIGNGQVVPYALVGLATGVLLGGVVSYVMARRRRRFEDRFDPEALYRVPLLGDVPAFNRDQLASRLPISTDPTSVAAESFRFVAASLKVLALSEDSVTLSFVSARSRAGKTVVSANVALALAQTGCRVLAVDADFLRQDLTRTLLGRVPGSGLVEVMEGRMALDDAVLEVISTESGSLEVLPGGLEGFLVPGMSRRHLGAFMVRAKVDHDVVVVDGPPLLEVAYATDLLSSLDAAVMLISHHEPVKDHPAMVGRLKIMDAGVCGYVYNRAPLREQLTSYYQGYRSTDGSPPSADRGYDSAPDAAAGTPVQTGDDGAPPRAASPPPPPPPPPVQVGAPPSSRPGTPG
jgi:Mrp family chromosome partitioning ATPase